MKNITVSVDERTHRLARIRAAELDTSVSALVREYLKHLVGIASSRLAAESSSGESKVERRRRMLRETIESITANGGGLRMAENLSRDELYDRARARLEAKAAASAKEESLNRG